MNQMQKIDFLIRHTKHHLQIDGMNFVEAALRHAIRDFELNEAMYGKLNKRQTRITFSDMQTVITAVKNNI